ncbi:hypothetical protein [Thiobacillus sp.]|uniref:hypothetical protein n=1 Tax=Thiobacillus sp. TaxID=924 RepID=UPI0025DB14D8|nr:hypothetical protein [Thiobacillus sp.]
MKPATGAHAGTGIWLVQRATAVVLAVALPGLMAHFLLALPVDFPDGRDCSHRFGCGFCCC